MMRTLSCSPYTRLPLSVQHDDRSRCWREAVAIAIGNLSLVVTVVLIGALIDIVLQALVGMFNAIGRVSAEQTVDRSIADADVRGAFEMINSECTAKQTAGRCDRSVLRVARATNATLRVARATNATLRVARATNATLRVA